MTIGDFELFCERNQNGMYRVALQILYDSQRAEDAVQDAFVRIFRISRDLDFDTERAEKLYALRAVKSAAIDILRRQKPADPLDEVEQLSFSRGDTTFHAVSSRETMDLINRLLGPRAQAIFCFRRIGLSDAEIAATLDISISNVRSTVYRARQRISDILRDEEAMIV